MIIFSPGWPQRQQNGHFTYTNFNIIGQIPLDLGVEVRLLRKSVQGHCQKKNPPCGELRFYPLNRGASLCSEWE